MHAPSSLESALLIVLILLSAGAFFWRFRRILKTILASKPDSDFHLTPLGPRLRRFASEVLLQSKVIRHRPLPGLAHALVFWGFCAFVLATVNHVALGFGWEPIPRDTGAGHAYLAAVAVFAALVAVAITGLAIRRFVVRPRWLGEVSPESGIVALLILLLMITYLADFFSLGNLLAQRINWWAHTLCLLVFLPLIPHTKHLHLALSPVTIFLGRQGFSRIPPLAGDEDFGLDTGRDVTRTDALQAYTCVECGRCTEHCPASNTGKVLNPKEIALGLRDYLNDNGPSAAEPLLGPHLSQEAAFQCTTCGACEYQCPVGIQHLPLITGLRRGAVNTGKWEDEHGSQVFLNLERHGNPLGISPRERDKFVRQSNLPVYDGSQDYCLWLGCMGSYDPQGQKTVLSLVRVLDHLEFSYGVLRRESCTGDSARRLGNDLAFEELARANLEQLARKKVNRLLSICPHCVRTISVDWREFGEAPPIEHHSEFLARHADKLAGSAGGKVVFHDPCYLGRYRNIYDEPRRIAAKAGDLVEPDLTRDRSFCCGAGGGLVFLGEEKGERVNTARARQLTATGADQIAVACPFCHTMFADALKSQKTDARLVDIAQIAASDLE